MTVFNFVGFLAIIFIVFVIGMVLGNWLKTKGIEDSGYRIYYTPSSMRKYYIVDVSDNPTGFDPTIGSYQDLFKK